MIVNNCASLSFLLVTKSKQQSKFGNGKNRSAWSDIDLNIQTLMLQYARYVVVYNVYIYRKHQDT